MEHNARNQLPAIYLDEKGIVITATNYLATIYPFDPYVLKRCVLNLLLLNKIYLIESFRLVRSGKKIAPFYVDYEEKEIDEAMEHKDCELDDFIDQSHSTVISPKVNRFTYGASPGFKFKS